MPIIQQDASFQHPLVSILLNKIQQPAPVTQSPLCIKNNESSVKWNLNFYFLHSIPQANKYVAASYLL